MLRLPAYWVQSLSTAAYRPLTLAIYRLNGGPYYTDALRISFCTGGEFFCAGVQIEQIFVQNKTFLVLKFCLWSPMEFKNCSASVQMLCVWHSKTILPSKLNGQKHIVRSRCCPVWPIMQRKVSWRGTCSSIQIRPPHTQCAFSASSRPCYISKAKCCTRVFAHGFTPGLAPDIAFTLPISLVVCSLMFYLAENIGTDEFYIHHYERNSPCRVGCLSWGLGVPINSFAQLDTENASNLWLLVFNDSNSCESSIFSSCSMSVGPRLVEFHGVLEFIE